MATVGVAKSGVEQNCYQAKRSHVAGGGGGGMKKVKYTKGLVKRAATVRTERLGPLFKSRT